MSNPRVISGKARGMRLQMVPGDITRPITDRVKEALFNIIGADIVEANIIDLFGGTGAVGIEALSRGAAFARIIDLNQAAIQTIKKNLESTKTRDQADVIQADAFAYLRRKPDRAFEYVYIAPPQYKGMWQRALTELDSNPAWASEDAWVIVQIHPIESEAITLSHFTEFERRDYGSTLLIFFERVPEASA